MNPFSSLQSWLGVRLDRWSPAFAFFSFVLASLFWARGAHLYLDNLAAFLWPSLWGSLVVAVICAFREKRGAFFMAGAAFASNLWLISPWMIETSFKENAADSQSYPYAFKLAVANVQTENRNYDKVLGWVAGYKPDVLILIEVDDRWIDGVKSVEAELSHKLLDPRDRHMGIAVYSRHPLLSKTVETFSSEGINSLNILVNAPGGPIRVMATHAMPPSSAAWFEDRNRHMEKMGIWSRTVSEDLIVAGDMNIAPWSTHYRPIESGGLRNVRPQSGVMASWPTYFPSWMRTPIDHVLYRGGLILKTARLGPPIGSDHMPIEAEFVR